MKEINTSIEITAAPERAWRVMNRALKNVTEAK